MGGADGYGLSLGREWVLRSAGAATGGAGADGGAVDGAGTSGGGVQRAEVLRPATKGAGRRGIRACRVVAVAAQAVMSAALGRGQPAFAARRSAAGWRLAGGGVRARLGARWGRALTGGVSLSLRVVGLGRGGRLAPRSASVSARANRVVYDRGVVREWYAAGPLGIEQGFTLQRRPAGAGGPLTLALGLAGSACAGVGVAGAVSDSLGPGGSALRGSAALDASGRGCKRGLSARRQAAGSCRGSRGALSAADRPVDPAGQSSSAAARRAPATSATAWRCRPTATRR